MLMENFVLYDELAATKHVTVFKGRLKKTLEWCAVKRYAGKADDTEALARTVAVLQGISSPNVLRLVGWYTTSRHSWLVTEFCSGGCLERVLCEDGPLPEQSVRLFAADILSGVAAAHTAGIALRALRPRGLLLDEHGNVKISEVSWAVGPTGPPVALPLSPSIAPELLVTAAHPCGASSRRPFDGASAAADFWAFGCVLVRMATGHLLDAVFDSPDACSRAVEEALERVRTESAAGDGISGASAPRLSALFCDLVALLLAPDPRRRPSWDQLVHNPWWRVGTWASGASESYATALPASLLKTTERLVWAADDPPCKPAAARQDAVTCTHDPLNRLQVTDADAGGDLGTDAHLDASSQKPAAVPPPPPPAAHGASVLGLQAHVTAECVLFSVVGGVQSAHSKEVAGLAAAEPPLFQAAPFVHSNLTSLDESEIPPEDDTLAFVSILQATPPHVDATATVAPSIAPPPTPGPPPSAEPMRMDPCLPIPVSRALSAFLAPGRHSWRPCPPMLCVIGRSMPDSVAVEASDGFPRDYLAGALSSIMSGNHAEQAVVLADLIATARTSAPLCDAAMTGATIAIFLRLVQRSRSPRVRLIASELCATVCGGCTSLAFSPSDAVSFALALVASAFTDPSRSARMGPTSSAAGSRGGGQVHQPQASRWNAMQWMALAAAEFLFCAATQFDGSDPATAPAVHLLVAAIVDFASRAAADIDPVIALVATFCFANVCTANVSPPLVADERARAAALACASHVLTHLRTVVASLGELVVPRAFAACAELLRWSCAAPGVTATPIHSFVSLVTTGDVLPWRVDTAGGSVLDAAVSASLCLLLTSLSTNGVSCKARAVAAAVLRTLLSSDSLVDELSAAARALASLPSPFSLCDLALLACVVATDPANGVTSEEFVVFFSALLESGCEIDEVTLCACASALCTSIYGVLRMGCPSPRATVAALRSATLLYTAAAGRTACFVENAFGDAVAAGVLCCCRLLISPRAHLDTPPRVVASTSAWLDLASSVLCDFSLEQGPVTAGLYARELCRALSALVPTAAITALVGSAAAAVMSRVESSQGFATGQGNDHVVGVAESRFFLNLCRLNAEVASVALLAWTPDSASLLEAARAAFPELAAALGDWEPFAAPAITGAVVSPSPAPPQSPLTPAGLLGALAHLLPLIVNRASGVRWLRGLLACAQASPAFTRTLAASSADGTFPMIDSLREVVAEGSRSAVTTTGTPLAPINCRAASDAVLVGKIADKGQSVRVKGDSLLPPVGHQRCTTARSAGGIAAALLRLLEQAPFVSPLPATGLLQ